MMPLGEAFYRCRVAAIQAQLATENLHGILLLDTFNVMYASGFIHTESERPIGFFVPAAGDPTLFVPLLEIENAAATWVGDNRSYFEFPGEEHPVCWMLREAASPAIGIEGHEGPWLAPGDRTILQPNMVFSNEPGIYRAGRDGYRLIDTMIVGDSEALVPSRFLAEHPPEQGILNI